MKTSDAGIHAASLAGIWQSVFFGFGGVRMLHGKLRICPLLPDEWKKLDFFFSWKGQRLHVIIDKEKLEIINETKTKPVELSVYGNNYQILDEITVKYGEMI